MGILIFTVLSFNLCFGFSANVELSKGSRTIVASKKDGTIKVIENKKGKIKVTYDATASYGALSGKKEQQGDLKTPTGVYFGTSFMGPDELPDETYGPMAVTLNYPNPLDIKSQRSGGGIWIHGTDESTRLGPKTSTRGCIILQNPDLLKLIRFIRLKEVPILIIGDNDKVSVVPSKTDGTYVTVLDGSLKYKVSTGLEKSKDIVYEEIK